MGSWPLPRVFQIDNRFDGKVFHGFEDKKLIDADYVLALDI